ncbi:MAG TPA: sigma-54 dependent transcriptional regulator [Ignavibacteriaceae bacterium]|nr:sigma-54 dependent transcriptional regulator [Ignavibacteriaceae bacterium]
MINNILIIDDEKELSSLLARLLSLEGYNTDIAATAREGLYLFKREEHALVITDVRLPDADGLSLLGEIKKINPFSEVIVLTAYGTIEDGVKAIKDGAFDYITKGDEDNKIVPVVKSAMEKAMMHRRIEHLEKQVGEKFSFDNITGNSTAIRHALDIAGKVADTDTPVLLIGETGTGKEIFAQAIHYAGRRKKNQFVAINCSAFSKDLLESEMFGYIAGAFTGANKNKKGLFEEADNGTLFLDEIGELDISLQAKFLRAIESNSFIKAGDTKTTKVDVRIIAATNRNLEDEIKKGNFRDDLFYRISVVKLEIPPLRERKEDIKELAEYFIEFYSRKLNRIIANVSPGFISALQNYNFPGNIRELRNIIERAVILSESKNLDVNLLPKEILFSNENIYSPVSKNLEEIEKSHILSVLKDTGGNKTKAAEILGIGLTTLYRKLQSYGIE